MPELSRPVEVDQEYYFDEHKEIGNCVPENIDELTRLIDDTYNNNRANYFDEIKQSVHPL